MTKQNTRNFIDLGQRERRMVMEILQAWDEHGLPDDFDCDGATWEFNPNSGNVFLINENFDCCMVSYDKLESWYHCFNCGHEGFSEDCKLNGGGCGECNPIQVEVT